MKPAFPGTKTKDIKRKYRPKSFMKTDAEILIKILADRIQQHIKKDYTYDQEGYTPRTQGLFT